MNSSLFSHLVANDTTNMKNKLHCVDGMLLPVWIPLEDVSQVEIAIRGIIYLISMFYLFVGVSILVDKFMASIEMITSTKKEVEMRDEHGNMTVVVVRVWNETVANLTLMALGCSAPEILLSSIEIIGKGFEAGELGPGSTVGSAAFNLFIILGVCNYVIPDTEVRKVKRVSVFLVTAVWSIFAYLWLYIILSAISPGVVEVWEAVITLICFPVTVVSAYLADRHIVIYDYFSKRYRMSRTGVIVEMTANDDEAAEYDRRNSDVFFKKFSEENENEELREFEDNRRSFIILMKNLRRKYPAMDSRQLELMAAKELLDRNTTSRAFYHAIASKMFPGPATQSDRSKVDFTDLFQEIQSDASSETQATSNDEQITKVFFSPGHYTVKENIGEFSVNVVREGGDLSGEVLVDFVTEDGEAIANRDYVPMQGTLHFKSNETCKSITVKIIDDNIYEEDQHFYIRLLNLRSLTRFYYHNTNGAVSDDAYATKAVVHQQIVHQLAPSYSQTLAGPEDSPPRYSVTAGQISTFSPNCKPSDEEESECSDDVFSDAVSELDSTNSFCYTNDAYSVEMSTDHTVTIPPDSSTADDSSTSVAVHSTFNEIPANSLRLVCPSLATVMILDDDHQGIFSLCERSISLTESVGTHCATIIRCGGSRGTIAVPYRTEEATAKAGIDYQPCQGEVIFEDGETEKSVPIFIVVKKSYEKDASFYFSLGEPRKVKDENDNDAHIDQQVNIRNYSQLTDQQRIAIRGRAQLGEIVTTRIRIKESKEFKKILDNVLSKANKTIREGTSSWKHQFTEAFSMSSDQSEPDDSVSFNSEPEKRKWTKYVSYSLTVLWRLIFGLIPPESLGGGYPCFVTCVVFIGVITSLIGDVSSHFGCTVGLKDSVTAMAFVSLGTSLPDLFASKVAAIHDQTADASISNVTGSNAVNVFLGIGVAWTLASIYHFYHGTTFYVDPGNLAFSVTLFCCMASVTTILLLVRRCEAVGGELGGPTKYRVPTTIFLVLCWILYVVFSALESYNYVHGL